MTGRPLAKVRGRRPNSEIDTKAFWTSAPSFYALMYERSKSRVVCNLAFDDGRMAMLVSALRYVPLAAARPRGSSGGLLLTGRRHENAWLPGMAFPGPSYRVILQTYLPLYEQRTAWDCVRWSAS